MHKILFVTGSLRRGGAERVITILANNLVKRGYSVEIATLLYSEVEYSVDNNIKIVDLSDSQKNQFLDSFRLVKELRRLIKDDDIDVVISFMVTINILTRISTLGLKIKFIPSERNDPKVGRKKILRLLQNFVYSSSSVTVVQTDRALKSMPANVQKNCTIISNPISISASASEIKQKRIVSIGRLEKQKNQGMLINTFSLIHNYFPDYILEFYGEGSLLKELQAETKKLGIEKMVVFHGNCDDVHKRISNATMFVMSSDFEGQSNALLEALMMGLPCVATNCAGVDEAIEDGVNGLVVPVGDSEALFKAMFKVLSDSSLADELGNRAKLSTKKYEVVTIVDKWCSLIEG